jgi:hypothetical protein
MRECLQHVPQSVSRGKLLRRGILSYPACWARSAYIGKRKRRPFRCVAAQLHAAQTARLHVCGRPAHTSRNSPVSSGRLGQSAGRNSPAMPIPITPPSSPHLSATAHRLQLGAKQACDAAPKRRDYRTQRLPCAPAPNHRALRCVSNTCRCGLLDHGRQVMRTEMPSSLSKNSQIPADHIGAQKRSALDTQLRLAPDISRI